LKNLFGNVFVIVCVVCKFLVMKAEHTVASYNGSDFTNENATVQAFLFFLHRMFLAKTKKNIF
jgi:hypothetical protein